MALLVPVLAIPARAEDPLDPFLGDAGTTLPNLVPDVTDVRISNTRIVDDGLRTEFGLFLWFDTRAQNLGEVPVQLTVDDVESFATSTVSQCVSWRDADAHLCSETAVAGGYTWHDAHRHFHYEDFAAYQLRSLAPDGRPDYSPAGLLRVAEKVSFCFIDSYTVRDDAFPTQFYATCTPTQQGISPGWTDSYEANYEGQNLDILGLPNGRYALITDLDYENTLRETDNDDNYIEVTVEIFDDPGHFLKRNVRILGKRWPLPNDRGTAAPTTTTTLTTTTTVATTTPPTAPEQVRVLTGEPPSSTPPPRRRPSTSTNPACPTWFQTCNRPWSRSG